MKRLYAWFKDIKIIRKSNMVDRLNRIDDALLEVSLLDDGSLPKEVSIAISELNKEFRLLRREYDRQADITFYTK